MRLFDRAVILSVVEDVRRQSAFQDAVSRTCGVSVLFDLLGLLSKSAVLVVKVY